MQYISNSLTNIVNKYSSAVNTPVKWHECTKDNECNQTLKETEQQTRALSQNVTNNTSLH